MGITMRGPWETHGENEEQEKEAAAAAGRLAGLPEVEEALNVDSNSELKTEGDPKHGETGFSLHPGDLSGWDGGGRLGWSEQGPLTSRAGSTPLRKTRSMQSEATPALCPHSNAPGHIRNSTIRTHVQSDVKMLGRNREEGSLWKGAGYAWGGTHILTLFPIRHPWLQRTGQGHPLPKVLSSPQGSACLLLSTPRERTRAEPAAPWPGAQGTPWKDSRARLGGRGPGR